MHLSWMRRNSEYFWFKFEVLHKVLSKFTSSGDLYFKIGEISLFTTISPPPRTQVNEIIVPTYANVERSQSTYLP